MVFSFRCPACQATVSGSDLLAGRRIRCPECNTMVEARDRATGTILLTAGSAESGETVMLEVVEVTESDDPMDSLDVAEPVEVAEPLEVTEPVEVAGPLEVTEPIEVTRPADGRGESLPPRGSPPGQPRRTDSGDEPQEPVQSKRTVEETEMDMTPMVDVTFLLLIFFMVTAAFTVQKSIAVPKPSLEEPSESVVEQDPDDQSDFVTVQVDQYNTFHVITVDWEEEAPSEQDLHIMLRRARDGDSTGTVPSKLRVEAHGDSLHEKVVAALDAGTATGFGEVQLATIEDE